MVTLHAFLALLAGVAVIAALSALMAVLMRWLTPDWTRAQGKPQPGYLIVNAGTTFLAGAAGGYLTAFLAGANPLGYVLVLAIAVLALAGLNALQMRGQLPIGAQLVLVTLAPLGVLAGGLLRLQAAGIL